eukprot:CAMPEP_0113969650 /NCGR_PEP_ID=MMETSP0011_2-20120614/10492_1 /TAXON_ID=101924 /ORGANISM="Rhodosorus marinus" /LENGTH=471 /DNA_ID=CAMNT_0000983445 /DNA_START=147 /DNA_END=1565 /DNA_ORIENTATION=- /assembly_acc=CAM_ASM_000156
MGLGISGTGSMPTDIKVAKGIAASWTGEGKSLNSKINDQVAMIPPWVLAKAHGVCFLFFLRAGFLWSGELGTGFVIAKINRGTPQERWSAPTAITSGGMGWGLLIGAQKQYHVVVLNSKNALRTFSSQGKMNIGGDIGVAAGPVGRNADVKVDVGNKGVAASYSYSYSQGLFAGLAINGAVIVANPAMNKGFYGKEISPKDLLTGADGLREADSNFEYTELHRHLATALGGSVHGSEAMSQNTDQPNSGGPGAMEVDYFGLSGRSGSERHAGGDGYSRSNSAARGALSTSSRRVSEQASGYGGGGGSGNYNDFVSRRPSDQYGSRGDTYSEASRAASRGYYGGGDPRSNYYQDGQRDYRDYPSDHYGGSRDPPRDAYGGPRDYPPRAYQEPRDGRAEYDRAYSGRSYSDYYQRYGTGSRQQGNGASRSGGYPSQEDDRDGQAGGGYSNNDGRNTQGRSGSYRGGGGYPSRI